MTRRTLTDDMTALLALYGVEGPIISIDAYDQELRVVCARLEGPALTIEYLLDARAVVDTRGAGSPIYDELKRESERQYTFSFDASAAGGSWLTFEVEGGRVMYRGDFSWP